LFHINKLNGIVHNICVIQDRFNRALTDHVHITTLPGVPTTPSESLLAEGLLAQIRILQPLQADLKINKTNLELLEKNSLSLAGSKYINSRYNNTN